MNRIKSQAAMFFVLLTAGCAAPVDYQEVSANPEELSRLNVELAATFSGSSNRPGEGTSQADTYLIGFENCAGFGVPAPSIDKQTCCENAGCVVTRDAMTTACGDMVPVSVTCDCGTGTIADGISPDEYAAGSLNDDLAYLACITGKD